MKDNKDIIPIIIDGEINDGRQRRKQKTIDNARLPKKKFTIIDILLTLISLAFIVYGLNSMLNKDNKKENKKVNNDTINYKVYLKYIPSNIVDGYNIYSTEDNVLLNDTLLVSNLSNNAILSFGSRIASKVSVDKEKYITEEEMDNSIKKIFGNIEYTKESFKYGDKSYYYNKETKRYYLESTNNLNITFDRIDYVDYKDEDNKLIIRDYVVFTYLDKQTTLGGTMVNSITKDNIKDNLNNIKYYEYIFDKNNDGYVLKSISIK